MKISFHYSSEDDILTIYSDSRPKETIEANEFINVDINKDDEIVGLEIFDASEFFGKQNSGLTKEILQDIKNIGIESDEFRNNWFIRIKITDQKGNEFVEKLPPLRRSEYKSPLIANSS